MTVTASNRARTIALLSTATLAAAAFTMIATPASAAPGEGGEGSITVFKLEQPDGDLGPNDGSILDTTGAKPVVAGFTTCTIDDIDLSAASDWDRLRNITITLDANGSPIVSESGTALSTSCGAEQTTDAETGGTTFASLPADKAYVVYESSMPANAVAVAEPTLLTIPYPGAGTGDVWNYHPAIYPKNVLAGSGSTKNGSIIGDQVTFDVTVPVNALAAGETYAQFRIRDALSASLKYTGASVMLRDAAGAPVPLVEGTDYTLTAPSGDGGDVVVFDMLTSGLAALDANIGGVFVLTINADAIGTGDTSNTAEITVNGATGEATVVDPDEFFSGARIMKEAQNRGATSNVPLAGAQFDVYAADASATSCPAEPAADAERVLSGETSGADGLTPSRVLAAGTYCVYETVVPAGYRGLQGGLLFEVAGADSSITVVNEQIGSAEGDLPSLPLTGGSGTALLLGAGAALVALGVGAYFFLAARRRRQEEEEAAGVPNL